MVHSALAQWLVEPDASLLKLYTDIATERIEALPNDTDLVSFMDLIQKGASLMIGYQKQYKTPLPNNYCLLQPEQEVHIAFYNAGDDDDSNFLKMKLDALVQDDHDTIYVLEHKTYSRQPTQEALDMNDQFLAYIWGATKLGLGKVGGLLYDGIGKTKVPTYYRTLLYRSDYELSEFESTLTSEADDIERATSYFPNRRWEGCYDCNFVKLCVAQSRGEDTDYIKSEFFTVRPPSEADLLMEVE
jgi:hypothetical protein